MIINLIRVKRGKVGLKSLFANTVAKGMQWMG